MDHTYINLDKIRKSARPSVLRPKPCSHNKIKVKNGADVVMYSFFFFLSTLFQFGLTIAPIQNSGLINAKYNNALYGTIIIWYNK